MGGFFISAETMLGWLGSERWPLVFDVRRRQAFDADGRVLPAARWRSHQEVCDWGRLLPAQARIVVYCAHGRQVSQSVTAALRARGLEAQALQGGMEGWRAAGGPTVLKGGLPGREETRPSRWVTRLRPKIDRIACPWFIRRFVDPDAAFLFVAPDQVAAAAAELGAVAYDVENVDFTHDGERCTFDAFLDRFGIDDPTLREVATIVRGADTGRFDLAPQAPGLLALSLGLSALAGDDDGWAVERGMAFYDALYAWRRWAAAESHGWPPRAVTA